MRVYFTLLDPHTIFGSVGRCGGGYNTVWEDWSPSGRIARENITREYEEGLNAICGHYDKLNASILSEGFRNPLIVTRGYPLKRKTTQIPLEVLKQPLGERYILEGVTGGSRLWVAQEYNIPVPCIVNDRSSERVSNKLVTNSQEALTLFKDPPKSLYLDRRYGIVEAYDNYKSSYHLEDHWLEDDLVKLRAPLWVSLMNKYGYYVYRLQPFVENILKEAGIVQPDNLKLKHPAKK
jgi:hypothetical protein